MSQGTNGLNERWIQIFLAGVFLLTCVSASIGQCVDNPDRRRKDTEPVPQPRPSPNIDFCDPQLLQGPGIVYQPCRRCEATLPREQIKEDRAYLEFLSQSVVIAGVNADELDLQAASQWAAEVRKRVRRLKASLALPETENEATSSTSEDAPVPSNRADLATALLTLSQLTSESLRNPVLSGLLLDQALAAKAVRDFRQIEILAGLIQNGCQILGKASR